MSYLHDEYSIEYQRGFPAFIVGVDIIEAAQKSPELWSRVARNASFTYYAGIAEMREAIHVMNPRLTVTSDAVLTAIEREIGDSTLRRWAHITKVIWDLFPDSGSSRTPLPLKTADIPIIVAAVGAEHETDTD